MTIRCRIAPSPTGPLHIGTARTALFNYLFARHHGGTFILRLEDTDVARSRLEHERDILDGLHWLGLQWDEGPEVAGLPARGPYGPYRQMQRLETYREAAERLLVAGLAYECFCSQADHALERADRAGPGDRDSRATEAPAVPADRAGPAAETPGTSPGRAQQSCGCRGLTSEARRGLRAEGRRPAIRFRIAEGSVEFEDVVRGRVAIDTAALGGDLVIVRSDGTPLYHFSVVVDDASMAITHVIRGEDHLSNTPKHILLFRALGAAVPAFAHLPLILNPDRTKMSKRKSQTAVADYRAQGFIREAVVNHLALLGWSSGTDEEVFDLDELIERFDLARVQPSGAVFDRERLAWLNGQWIRRLPDDELVERSLPFLARSLEAAAGEGAHVRTLGTDDLATLLPLVRERLPRLDAIGPLVDYLFLDQVALDAALLVPRRWDAALTAEGLAAARDVVAEVGRVSFEADELESALRALCGQRGWKAGDLFMAIRVACTGRTATPPLFDVLVALGYERSLGRLDAALALLAAGPVLGHDGAS